MPQTKLSRHQKMILSILHEEIKDEFWGIPTTYLSWIAAQKLERKSGDYVENMKEWRRQRREEETNKFREGKIDRETLNITLYFLRDRRGKQDEVLTEKWRATFSRCLKRLEVRGLIKRIGSIRYEKRGDVPYWVRYVGGRTRRVVLTPQGRTMLSVEDD